MVCFRWCHPRNVDARRIVDELQGRRMNEPPQFALSRDVRFEPEESPGRPADFEDLIRSSTHLPLDAQLLERHLDADRAPIPPPRYRQNYYSDRHHDYWRSGVWDYVQILAQWNRFFPARTFNSYFDFGGSSGRVARHFSAMHPECTVYVSDLAISSIEWALANLPGNVKAFQGVTVPTLPLPDHSIDLLTGFSVFTHIDTHEYGWLAELGRVMSDDGLLYVTVMTEEVWDAFMRLDWRYEQFVKGNVGFDAFQRGVAMPEKRMPFYSRSGENLTIFHSKEHIRSVWSRFFDVVDIIPPKLAHEQSVVVMKPRSA